MTTWDYRMKSRRQHYKPTQVLLNKPKNSPGWQNQNG